MKEDEVRRKVFECFLQRKDCVVLRKEEDESICLMAGTLNLIEVVGGFSGLTAKEEHVTIMLVDVKRVEDAH
jgi:hypothetical protein